MTPEFKVILFIELLAILSGAYNWKKLSLPYRLTVLLVAFAVITELTGRIISHYFHQNNVWLYNLYNPVEMWVLGFICILFVNTKVGKKTIQASLFMLSLFWCITVGYNGIFAFNNWFVVLKSLFHIVCFIVILFDNSVFNKKKIYTQPLFLLSTGMILYYATTIPLFGLMNYLVKNDSKMALKLFHINHAATAIRYALVAVAFYLYARQAKRAHVSG